jgi:hypothetical protein
MVSNRLKLAGFRLSQLGSENIWKISIPPQYLEKLERASCEIFPKAPQLQKATSVIGF